MRRSPFYQRYKYKRSNNPSSRRDVNSIASSPKDARSFSSEEDNAQGVNYSSSDEGAKEENKRL